MKIRLLFAALLLAASPAFGQSVWPANKVQFADTDTLEAERDRHRVFAFASLPTCDSGANGNVFIVNNSSSSGACNGSGSADAECLCDGTSYVALSGGGGGGAVATDVIWDTKGDLAVATGPDAAIKLPAGSDERVLISLASEATGLQWRQIDNDSIAPGAGIFVGKIEAINLIEADIGAGLEVVSGTVNTKSDEDGFIIDLGAGDLACGGTQAGRMAVNDADPLQYCDGEATPVRRLAAYGNDAGNAVNVAGGGFINADELNAAGAVDATHSGSAHHVAESPASESVVGIIEHATQTETNDGTVGNLAVTAEKLDAKALSGGDLGGTIGTPTVLSVQSLVAGPGLGIAAGLLETDSDEQDFLFDGQAVSIVCGSNQEGRIRVHNTEPLQYCDGNTISLKRFAADADAGGDALGVGTGAVAQIADIVVAIKTGDDGELVTGTAGGTGNCAEWDTNGDLIEAASAAPCGSGGGMANFQIDGDDNDPRTVNNAEVVTITGGPGIVTNTEASESAPEIVVATKSDEQDFLFDNDAVTLACGASTKGKIVVHDTEPAQYCDGATTAVKRFTTFGNASGEAVDVATDGVDAIADIAAAIKRSGASGTHLLATTATNPGATECVEWLTTGLLQPSGAACGTGGALRLDEILDSTAANKTFTFGDLNQFDLTRTFSTTGGETLEIEAIRTAGISGFQALRLVIDNEGGDNDADGLQIEMKASAAGRGYGKGIDMSYQELTEPLLAAIRIFSLGGPITEALDLDDSDIAVALNAGTNDNVLGGLTVTTAAWDALFDLTSGVDDADGEHTHALKANLANPTFTGLVTIDDLLVDGEIDIGTQQVFTTPDTTPDVSDGAYWKTNAVLNLITDFDGTQPGGSVIYVESDGSAVFDCTGSALICGRADVTTADGDVLAWLFNGTAWSLIGRKQNYTEYITVVIETPATTDDILIAKARGGAGTVVQFRGMNCVAQAGSVPNMTVMVAVCGAGGTTCTDVHTTDLTIDALDTNFALPTTLLGDFTATSNQWLKFLTESVTVAPDFLNCQIEVQRFYPT